MAAFSARLLEQLSAPAVEPAAERIIRAMLERADIVVGGARPHDVAVKDPRFYVRALRDGLLGLGESYVDGWWDCEALDEFAARAAAAQIGRSILDVRALAWAAAARILNPQRGRAFEVGERHYDLGNDLFEAMLDRRLVYTCAYWDGAATLDEAQEAKLALVCRKVGLVAGMRILDLGCGFGGFARYAAERYGVHVTGLTVSRAQWELGRALCEHHDVDLRLQDWREASGTWDAVVSIGLMEHVGPQNHRAFMEHVDRLLAPGGVAFVHTIGANRRGTLINPWFHKYIFPNASIPSLGQITQAMDGLFVPEDVHNFGPHYDRTLLEWHARFESAWPRLAPRYGETFRRMWRFYLLVSAGAFRARELQLFHVVMTRPGTPQPRHCRA